MEKYIKTRLPSSTPKIKVGNSTNNSTTTLLIALQAMVKEMTSTTSIIEKRKLYTSAMKKDDAHRLAELVQLIYHPLYRFNVTGKNVIKFEKTPAKQTKIKNKQIVPKTYVDGAQGDSILTTAVYQLLMDLSSNTISGDTALATVSAFRHTFPGLEDLILDIVDKDLKIRFGISQINNVLVEVGPKIAKYKIPDFQVSLGNPLDEKTENLLPTTSASLSSSTSLSASSVTSASWFISRKLDGVRCITIISYNPTKNGFNVNFYSRKGLEFKSLGKIKSVIEDHICPLLLGNTVTNYEKNGIVLDGELCIVDDNGKEDFQSVMSELQRTDATINNPKYLIFDCLRVSEFNDEYTSRNLSIRLSDVKQLLKASKAPLNRLEMVEQVPYTSEMFAEMSKNIQSPLKPDGWEGLILRKDTAYQGKRTNDLLKVKKFVREEFKVESIEVGKIEMFNAVGVPEDVETMTAVHIKHKTYDVKVGSGFSHAERQRFYNNPDLIVGKMISVQYFEETTDKKGNLSLRFPTFLGLYGKERTL